MHGYNTRRISHTNQHKPRTQRRLKERSEPFLIWNLELSENSLLPFARQSAGAGEFWEGNDMEELIKRLVRVIQTGAPDKDGMHPISAEAVLEVVRGLSEHGTNLAEVGTDCISRQAAIEAIDKTKTVRNENGELFVAKINAQMNIEQLPSAQPEPHWIPVEQDTPKEDGDYWATFGAETGWFVDWCSWYHGRWVVWLDDIPNDVSNVIAWCKPMEPYKGVTE